MQLRIEARNLPGRSWGGYHDVHVALQVGREPFEPVRADRDHAVWETEVSVVVGDSLDFRGPAVHGRKGERFLYLTWGELRDGSFVMFRRAKLMLADLGPGAGDASLAVARLSLTDAHGGPLCARVKLDVITWTLT